MLKKRRYIVNHLKDTARLTKEERKSFISKAIALIRQTWNIKYRHGTIYIGILGIVHVCLRLAINHKKSLHRYGTTVEELLQGGLIRSKTAQKCIPPPRIASLLEGRAGITALQIIIYKYLKNETAATAASQMLLSASNKNKGIAYTVLRMPPNECEILYGRCGYLQAILLVRKYLKESQFGKEAAKAVIQQVLTQGEQVARQQQSHFPLLWMWNNTIYYGAAHGMVGILYTLLHFIPEISICNENFLEKIETTVNRVVKEVLPNGNLPPIQGSTQDDIIHWCHGNPGLIFLLCKCATVFENKNKKNYLEQAIRCGNLVWQRGLLQKGVGLCHGISGNAYCFLALYRATKEEHWLHRAEQFALFSIKHLPDLGNIPDHPHSLYEGVLGLAALLLDLGEGSDPFKARFPGFEF